MRLLERQNFLDELTRIAETVKQSSGKTVLVTGEAGVGKTSLIKYFTDYLNSGTEVMLAACDDLFAPRPLGPLYDIAYQVKSDLVKKLTGQANRADIFSAFLNFLQSGSNLKVVVIEDVHWADEATLDLITFLTRRINRSKVLLLLSYRDEEIGQGSLRRSVFADLNHSEIKRLRLYPLSEKSVSILMKEAGIRDESLYERTGGNPFYISEMLAYQNEGLPLSVKEAVVARTASLDEDAKCLLEIISVITTKADIDFLRKFTDRLEESLDQCLSRGLLVMDKNLVSFRHELARLAIFDSISEMKRIQIHRKVLEQLLQSQNLQDVLAHIVHHAIRANERDIIIKYAPAAAGQASALAAHSLAAEHYSSAIKFADKLPPKELISLYEGRSYECYLTGQIDEAIKAGEKITELLQKYPDPEKEGENYRRLSRILWYNCEDIKGEEYLDKAISTLEKLPAGRSLAMAYSNKSQTYMIRELNGPAVEWGEKALALARELNDREIIAHALNNIGTSRMSLGDDSGEDDILQSLEIALSDNSFFEHAIRAYINLGGMYMYRRNLAKADKLFSEGIEFSREKDLYVFGLCLAGHYAKVKMLYGDWDKATEMAAYVLDKKSVPAANRLMPLSVVTTIRSRRNDPRAGELLDLTLELSLKMGEKEKIISTITAKADYCWLRNKLDGITDELKYVYQMMLQTNNPWTIGEIAYWMWKAGQLEEIPAHIAEPYLMHIKGDWKSAARYWEKSHCPYEQALALSEGDREAMIEAVRIFDSLGASAAVSLIKQKMRERGIKKIPKGPRESTRKNPGGLTGRQVDVLKLLTKGMSNSEIASSLFISPKTVDHHISAILAKLNLHSRTEAAAFVRTTGLNI